MATTKNDFGYENFTIEFELIENLKKAEELRSFLYFAKGMSNSRDFVNNPLLSNKLRCLLETINDLEKIAGTVSENILNTLKSNEQ